VPIIYFSVKWWNTLHQALGQPYRAVDAQTMLSGS